MQWTFYIAGSKVLIFPGSITTQQKFNIENAQTLNSEFKNVQEIKTALSELNVKTNYGRMKTFLEVFIPTDENVELFIEKIKNTISTKGTELKEEKNLEMKGTELLAKKVDEIFSTYDKPELVKTAIIYKTIEEYGDSSIVGDLNIKRDALLQLRTMIFFYYLAETKADEIKKILDVKEDNDTKMENISKWLVAESAHLNLYKIEQGTVFGSDFNRVNSEAILEHLKLGILQINNIYDEILKNPGYEYELFTNLIENSANGLNSDKSYVRTMIEMQSWLIEALPSVIEKTQEKSVIPDSPLSQQSDENNEISESPISHRRY